MSLLAYVSILPLQNEQTDTICKFRKGALNLLISTSVAEEGLDIPECNLVVRYGLLTNEIAQQQATGRARAQDSQYSVVAQRGGREVHREHINELLEELTGRAIAKVQEMSPHDFRAKVRMQSIPISCFYCLVFLPTHFIFLCLQINELQIQEVIGSKVANMHKMEKRGRFAASRVQLLCRNCFKSVASGSDIKLVENAHYVNVNPDFR